MTQDEYYKYLDEVANERATAQRGYDSGAVANLTAADFEGKTGDPDGIGSLSLVSPVDQYRFFLTNRFSPSGLKAYYAATVGGDYVIKAPGTLIDDNEDCLKHLEAITWTNPESILTGVALTAKCESKKLETNIGNEIVRIEKSIIAETKLLENKLEAFANPYILKVKGLFDSGVSLLEIVLFVILSGGIVLFVAAYRAGFFGYAKRAAIGLSGIGPIVGARDYYKLKQKEAEKKGTDVATEASKDLAIGAVNPLALIAKVVSEAAPETIPPEVFEAALS